MNRRIRRLSGLVVALVLSTTALATATAGAGGGAAEEPGLTADSLNVVLLYGDTARSSRRASSPSSATA